MSTTEVYKASDLRKDPALYTRLFEKASAAYRKGAQRAGAPLSAPGRKAKAARPAAGLLPGPGGQSLPVHDCFVGIDPGSSTGIAIRDTRGGNVLQIFTLDFWRTTELLPQLHQQHGERLLVVIEDPSLKKVMFARYDKKKEQGPAYYARVAQSVGENMAHAKLLIAFCQRQGISVDTVSPLGKLDADLFARLTGLTEGSQHARDAAGLILDR